MTTSRSPHSRDGPGWLLNENKETENKDDLTQIQEKDKEGDIETEEVKEEERSMILLSEKGGNRSHITTTTPMDVDTNITTLEEDRGPELEPFTKDGRSCASVEEGCSCKPTNENKDIYITYDDPKQWPDNFRSDAVRCKLVERGLLTVD